MRVVLCFLFLLVLSSVSFAQTQTVSKTLTWDRIGCMPTSRPSCTIKKYVIWRSLNGVKYDKVGEVPGSGEPTFTDGLIPADARGVCYKITAVSNVGEGQSSDPLFFALKPGVAAQVTGVTGTTPPVATGQ